MFLPIYDKSDPNNKSDLLSDEYWRLVFAFPIFLKISAMIIVPLKIKYFSLTKLITDLDPEEPISEELRVELSKIYVLKNDNDLNKLLKALKE
jgi:hypothetical protein